MPNQSLVLDQVFQVLSNPTRREVLAQLGNGPASMTELAKPFQMALPSFLQHLQLLEKCGLVRSRKTGRVRVFELEPQPLVAAEAWIKTQRNVWEARFDQLDRFLTTPEETEK